MFSSFEVCHQKLLLSASAQEPSVKCQNSLWSREQKSLANLMGHSSLFPLEHSPVEAEDDCCRSHTADDEKVNDVVLFSTSSYWFLSFSTWGERNKHCKISRADRAGQQLCEIKFFEFDLVQFIQNWPCDSSQRGDSGINLPGHTAAVRTSSCLKFTSK